MKGSTVFTVMVVGDNPEELMKNYDEGLKVEPYKVYEYSKADKMRESSISVLEEIISNPKKFNMNDYQIDFLKERINNIKKMSSFDYYSNLVKGLKIDEEGNAWSTQNPNGKWQTYKLGDNFSMPLILKDEKKESRQALMKDINWAKTHMVDTKLYDLVWDLVHEVKKPKNEKEETILNNMKDNKLYFSKFKDKKEYVTHCCSYWNFAYLDKNGWKDIDDSKNPNEWVAKFYETFVYKLNPNDKITIFECTKGKNDEDFS